MGTTSTAFSGKRTVDYVTSVCFDGLPVILTNGTTALMTTAFAATTDFSGATVYGGLMMIGKTGGKISPFDPSVQVDSLEFRVLESRGASTQAAGKLAAKFMTGKYGQTTWTSLNANIDCDDTTLPVDDGAVLTAATADGFIGNECFTYTVRPTTQPANLTVSVRGKYAIWQTEAGGRFATPHRISTDSAFKPVVSNAPRTEHFNRGVIVRQHRVDPATGAYDVTAQALVVWQGRLQSHRWNGDGSISLLCDSILKDLVNGTLMSDQFTAQIPRGWFAGTGSDRAQVFQFVAGDAANSLTDTFSYGGTNAQQTHGGLAAQVTGKLQSERAAGTITYEWSVGGSGVVGDPYFIACATSGLTASTAVDMSLSLTPIAWKMLGFEHITTGHWTDLSTGSAISMVLRRLVRTGANTFVLAASKAAIVYTFSLDDNTQLALENPAGTWAAQPSIPSLGLGLPSTTQGFLQVGQNALLAVLRTSDTSFTLLRNVSIVGARRGWIDPPEEAFSEIREGDEGAGASFRVQQIWYEDGPAADLFLRYLLSTGTASFNSNGSVGGTAYDTNAYGMGLGIPYSAVNLNSVRNVLGARPVSFLLDKATKFSEIFESQLAVAGANVVLKGGKITLVTPSPTGTNLAAAHSLSEANKVAPPGEDPQRLQVEYGAEGVINRVELKYGRRRDGSFAGTILVEDAASISNFGARKTLTINGYSIGDQDVNQWAQVVVGNVLAYWANPLARARRTFCHKQVGDDIAPGDTILLTDDGMPNPATGKLGVTNLAGIAVSVDFDWDSGIGTVEMILFPEADGSKLAAWAPAARVASSSASGGKLTVTCTANKYSESGGTADATYFPAGAKVLLEEYSPANPAAPATYQVTVDSQSGNNITFTTDPVPGALSTGVLWNVVYDTIATPVTAAQKAYSFLADDVTDTTGAAAHDTYFMGGVAPHITTGAAVTYSQRFTRFADTSDDQGRPYSVDVYADGLLGLNAHLSSVSQTFPLFWASDGSAHTAVTQVGTTYKVALAGWLPLMGFDRSLKFQIHGKHSTAGSSASYRLTLTPIMVRGASLTAASFLPLAYAQSTLTTNATTPKWLATNTVSTAGPVSDGALPYGLWACLEIKAGAGGETATLYGVHVREAALT